MSATWFAKELVIVVLNGQSHNDPACEIWLRWFHFGSTPVTSITGEALVFVSVLRIWSAKISIRASSFEFRIADWVMLAGNVPRAPVLTSYMTSHIMSRKRDGDHELVAIAGGKGALQ